MLMYMFIYDLREERASPSVGRLKKLRHSSAPGCRHLETNEKSWKIFRGEANITNGNCLL